MEHLNYVHVQKEPVHKQEITLTSVNEVSNISI